MATGKKRIAVLGSTGSIGLSSLAVIDSLEEHCRLVSVSAHCQWEQLARQARKYQLEKVVLTDPTHLDDLRQALAVAGSPQIGEGCTC